MGNFDFIKTSIDGVIIIETKLYGDERGYFSETYHKSEFEKGGIPFEFVQDNQSRSKKGVLRGLHFQKKNPQGKLVRVIEGSVLDIAVDLRPASPTFGKYESVILSDENKKLFYVPEGFAHGFVVLSDFATFCYKCTRFYDSTDEGGILWNDPEININWNADIENVILSEKDKNNKTFAEYRKELGL